MERHQKRLDEKKQRHRNLRLVEGPYVCPSWHDEEAVKVEVNPMAQKPQSLPLQRMLLP